jgi:hypothetical protein
MCAGCSLDSPRPWNQPCLFIHHQIELPEETMDLTLLPVRHETIEK